MPSAADKAADKADAKTLTACVGVRDTMADQTGEAHSADFSLGNATISSSAIGFRSDDDLQADMAIIRSPRLNACYENLYRSQIKATLPAGSTVDRVSIEFQAAPKGSPKNLVGLGSGSLVVSVNTQKVSVYLEIALIAGPLIEAEIDFINVGAPVSSAIRASLINRISARVASA